MSATATMTRDKLQLDHHACSGNMNDGHFTLVPSAISLVASANQTKPKPNNILQQNNEILSRRKKNAVTGQGQGQTLEQTESETDADLVSTIAILRRHPMYDSLLLAKRPYEGGFVLELPTSNITHNGCIRQLKSEGNEQNQHNKTAKTKQNQSACRGNKLVTVDLDGDDPIYLNEIERNSKSETKSEDCQIVYVPMNGLLDRLDNYERQGISIDGRVYAFAMGLKTAEKFLTSSSVKEIQEAPPL